MGRPHLLGVTYVLSATAPWTVEPLTRGPPGLSPSGSSAVPNNAHTTPVRPTVTPGRRTTSRSTRSNRVSSSQTPRDQTHRRRATIETAEAAPSESYLAQLDEENRVSATPEASVFEVPRSDEEDDLVAATEEVLELTRFKAVKFGNRKVAEHEEAKWDADFWREYDEQKWLDACRAESARSRLKHFLRLHRILSLTATGTNHTAVTLFRRVTSDAVAPLVESPETGRVAVAFWAYPGLGTAALAERLGLSASSLAGFDVRAGADVDLDALRDVFSTEDREKRRLDKLFPPKPIDADRDAMIASFLDDEGGVETFKTPTGEYGELVDDRPVEEFGEERTTDASIEATFRALDDHFGDDDDDDDDDPSDASLLRRRALVRGGADATRTSGRQRSGRTAYDDGLDDELGLFDDDDDDVFGTGALESEADDLFGLSGFDDDDDDEYQRVSDRRTRPSYERVIVKSDGRVDPLAPSLFEDLLAKAPGDPLSAYLVRVAPGASTPFASTRRPHVVTAYVRLTPGDAEVKVAPRVPAAAVVEHVSDAITVLDGSYLHAISNPSEANPTDDALFLVLEYFHPDLTEPEQDALRAFFRLDEQFLLRRFRPTQVLPVILNADLGRWWWTASSSHLSAPSSDDDDDDAVGGPGSIGSSSGSGRRRRLDETDAASDSPSSSSSSSSSSSRMMTTTTASAAAAAAAAGDSLGLDPALDRSYGLDPALDRSYSDFDDELDALFDDFDDAPPQRNTAQKKQRGGLKDRAPPARGDDDDDADDPFAEDSGDDDFLAALVASAPPDEFDEDPLFGDDE